MKLGRLRSLSHSSGSGADAAARLRPRSAGVTSRRAANTTPIRANKQNPLVLSGPAQQSRPWMGVQSPEQSGGAYTMVGREGFAPYRGGSRRGSRPKSRMSRAPRFDSKFGGRPSTAGGGVLMTNETSSGNPLASALSGGRLG
uniref:Uncharacterized protein n=1 Tax=Phaeomonas parva TaxID=124430 RepID=A0A7S1UKM8_9STRA|mmetsp:Transcript_9293/g.27300  ORF Transcript_9293/g.27300 Transcript_9293/m.27300 type:complete len:143 (+) Transcript_9293:108-536(+)